MCIPNLTVHAKWHVVYHCSCMPTFYGTPYAIHNFRALLTFYLSEKPKHALPLLEKYFNVLLMDKWTLIMIPIIQQNKIIAETSSDPCLILNMTQCIIMVILYFQSWQILLMVQLVCNNVVFSLFRIITYVPCQYHTKNAL